MEDNAQKVPTYNLTTIDNPFHPVKEYDDWQRFDEDHGYYSWNYVTRIAGTSDYLTEVENQRLINDAIDWIISHDLECIYTKVLVD